MPDVAHLEYILLSEYARQDQGGAVTIVAAHVDTVVARQLPVQHHLAIVGRAVLEPGEEPPMLKISIGAPDSSYLMTSEQLMEVPAEAPPEGLPLSASFIGNAVVPLTAYGVYKVSAQLDDQEAKVVRFRVISAPADVADR